MALLDVVHNFVQQRRMRLRPSTLRPPAVNRDQLNVWLGAHGLPRSFGAPSLPGYAASTTTKN
jgi:hypothetical protein